MRLLLIAALSLVGAVSQPLQAEALSLEVERYVAALSSAESKLALGLKELRRPAGIVNRLDVVFESHVSPERRATTLQEIGREFLRVLFEREMIPTVTVVERDGAGHTVNRAVVRIGAMLGPVQAARDC
jgi:hypothetical protein